MNPEHHINYHINAELQVKYCSENHRLLHHPEDHEEPWPIIVKYKPGVKLLEKQMFDLGLERWAG